MFRNNNDIKAFVKLLIQKMDDKCEKELSEELIKWNGDFFTTSSEYLGELKLIWEKIKHLETLDSKDRKEIINCIESINKALGYN